MRFTGIKHPRTRCTGTGNPQRLDGASYHSPLLMRFPICPQLDLLRRADGSAGPWGLRQSGILGWFAIMRWLVIGLLVCLGVLLFAAGALARHIWLHRKKLQHEPQAQLNARETDLGTEP